jgi:transcriptional regulator with XRE-family HTH domain
MTTATVGPLLRTWRERRRRSQLDLALDAGVSTRHLSFIETGRARPSPEVVLALARELDVPLREQNDLLLAAGYAPRYSETDLDAPAMHEIRAALRRLLDAHAPYPAIVVDRRWDLVLANAAAGLLTADLPAHVLGPPPNVFRLCLHPDGLAPRIVNFEAWAERLLAQLRRLVTVTQDAGLADLQKEVLAYPNVAGLGLHDATERWPIRSDDLVVPLRLRHGSGELSFFTTMMRFATPLDVTLDELAVEAFYPVDEPTRLALEAQAASA